MKIYKHLPNILSSLRIVGAVALLLCDVVGTTFWALYALCGISDIADGWLARRLKCVTRTGALLDSLADICFVACLCPLLLPILELPQWLWLWAGVIVAIKVVNQLSALTVSTPEGGVMMRRNFDFPSATAVIMHAIPTRGYESITTFNVEFYGFRTA
ncbi:MAG: CDP-alcohol phosphatidyltransferase family protein [Prevotella sp.]|nr:CDP-alcohol phosphatidyltransferase family protein [Prevotella sp.]